jgi:hypothetical protein
MAVIMWFLSGLTKTNLNDDTIFPKYQVPGTPSFFNNTINTLSTNVDDVSSDLIEHDLIEALGYTTNILIYAFFSNNPNKKFTRVKIRNALINHKETLESQGVETQHLARLRTGKATVNYWIDRLVEQNTLEKKHSNPVVFWINKKEIIKTTTPHTKQSPFVTMESWI